MFISGFNFFFRVQRRSCSTAESPAHLFAVGQVNAGREIAGHGHPTEALG
jgi:hypothetical protein